MWQNNFIIQTNVGTYYTFVLPYYRHIGIAYNMYYISVSRMYTKMGLVILKLCTYASLMSVLYMTPVCMMVAGSDGVIECRRAYISTSLYYNDATSIQLYLASGQFYIYCLY